MSHANAWVYETVAACLRVQGEWPDADERTIRMVAHALALEFELDDPRFDTELFLNACNV